MEIKIARLHIPCFSICHVLMPPTGEEDAITMALTMWAKSPWTCAWTNIAEIECLNKNLELNYAHMNVYHAQMQLFNIHSYSYVSCTVELTCIHSTCSFHIINSQHGCRSKNGQDHLSYEEVIPQPATSLQRST